MSVVGIEMSNAFGNVLNGGCHDFEWITVPNVTVPNMHLRDISSYFLGHVVGQIESASIFRTHS